MCPHEPSLAGLYLSELKTGGGGRWGRGKATGGLGHPSSTLVRGSYFFFSRRSFSAWVPNLAGTIGSCRLSSESVSRTGKEDMGMSAALLLLPWPGPRKQTSSNSSSRHLLHTEQPKQSQRVPISFPRPPPEVTTFQAAPEGHWLIHPRGVLSPGRVFQQDGPELFHSRPLGRAHYVSKTRCKANPKRKYEWTQKRIQKGLS